MSDPVDGTSDAPDAPPTAPLVLVEARDEAPPPAPGLVPQAQTDAQLLALWLFGRSPHTQRAYRREAARFLAHAGRPLREVTLAGSRSSGRVVQE